MVFLLFPLLIFTGFSVFFRCDRSIIGQFKMTMPSKGAKNGKNEENRLKIDKILFFLPFAQIIMFVFVIFSSHNQDRFRISSSQIGIYRLVPFLSKFFFNAISVGRIDPIKGIS